MTTLNPNHPCLPRFAELSRLFPKRHKKTEAVDQGLEKLSRAAEMTFPVANNLTAILHTPPTIETAAAASIVAIISILVEIILHKHFPSNKLTRWINNLAKETGESPENLIRNINSDLKASEYQLSLVQNKKGLIQLKYTSDHPIFVELNRLLQDPENYDSSKLMMLLKDLDPHISWDPLLGASDSPGIRAKITKYPRIILSHLFSILHQISGSFFPIEEIEEYFTPESESEPGSAAESPDESHRLLLKEEELGIGLGIVTILKLMRFAIKAYNQGDSAAFIRMMKKIQEGTPVIYGRNDIPAPIRKAIEKVRLETLKKKNNSFWNSILDREVQENKSYYGNFQVELLKEFEKINEKFNEEVKQKELEASNENKQWLSDWDHSQAAIKKIGENCCADILKAYLKISSKVNQKELEANNGWDYFQIVRKSIYDNSEDDIRKEYEKINEKIDQKELEISKANQKRLSDWNNSRAAIKKSLSPYDHAFGFREYGLVSLSTVGEIVSIALAITSIALLPSHPASALIIFTAVLALIVVAIYLKEVRQSLHIHSWKAQKKQHNAYHQRYEKERPRIEMIATIEEENQKIIQALKAQGLSKKEIKTWVIPIETPRSARDYYETIKEKMMVRIFSPLASTVLARLVLQAIKITALVAIVGALLGTYAVSLVGHVLLHYWNRNREIVRDRLDNLDLYEERVKINNIDLNKLKLVYEKIEPVTHNSDYSSQLLRARSTLFNEPIKELTNRYRMFIQPQTQVNEPARLLRYAPLPAERSGLYSGA